jgi:hypothetical protein
VAEERQGEVSGRPVSAGHPAWPPPETPPASRPGPAHISVEFEDDGPPVPPPLRRRRARRRAIGVALAIALLIGGPVVLTVTGVLELDGQRTDTDTPVDATAPDAEAAPEGTPPGAGGGAAEAPPRDDEDPSPPDLEQLDDTGVAFGQLLIDIDASERTMISWQDELGEIFGGSPGEDEDADELVDQVAALAEERRLQLLRVREHLERPRDHEGAELVREHYVVHLDSWAAYLGAIVESPVLAADAEASTSFRLEINTTASRFATTLEDELPGDIDAEVADFAEAILDRGFRAAQDAEA